MKTAKASVKTNRVKNLLPNPTIVFQDGDGLWIRLGLFEPKLSSTGKSLVVGSTGGPLPTDVDLDGHRIVVSATAYFDPTEDEFAGRIRASKARLSGRLK